MNDRRRLGHRLGTWVLMDRVDTRPKATTPTQVTVAVMTEMVCILFFPRSVLRRFKTLSRPGYSLGTGLSARVKQQRWVAIYVRGIF